MSTATPASGSVEAPEIEQPAPHTPYFNGESLANTVSAIQAVSAILAVSAAGRANESE